jgi:hypothetical protein
MDTAEGYVGALDMKLIYENARAADGQPAGRMARELRAVQLRRDSPLGPDGTRRSCTLARQYVQYIYVQK